MEPASFGEACKKTFQSKENPGLDDPVHFRVRKGYKIIHYCLANSYVLCKAGTTDMVVPEFFAPDDPEDKNEKRRSLLTHPHLRWTYTFDKRRAPRPLAAADGLPGCAREDAAGGHVPVLWLPVESHTQPSSIKPTNKSRLKNVVFPSADGDNALYVGQNPDKAYLPFFEHAQAVWALKKAQGVEVEELHTWVDINISKLRPWFCNKWVFKVMQLECGLPKRIKGDPDCLAMLGECRFATGAARRAPLTEEEWAALDSQLGDDEADDKDAMSIVDDVESGLPTSSSWGPATRMSTTPQGQEPHPRPDIVERLLKHREEHLRRLAAASEQQEGPDVTGQPEGQSRTSPAPSSRATTPASPPGPTPPSTGPEPLADQGVHLVPNPVPPVPDVPPAHEPAPALLPAPPAPANPPPLFETPGFFLPPPGAGLTRFRRRAGPSAREQSGGFTPAAGS
ncbi:hypothetical protein RhiJN_11714 [Ceratobasidium sp. AG-Ba]|nr:hypothetical protein RhiJN_11714 [Ceratobasidium sp. AG-Ba]